MPAEKRPFFSIIIPTSNSEASIVQCLESSKVQTFKNFEVVLVDNVSTDRTIQLAAAFAHDLQLSICSEMDGGIYDAMNKGIRQARGIYLYFMGSDDSFYEADVLHTVYHQIKDTKHKVVYGNVQMNGQNEWVKDGTIHAGLFDLKRLLSHNICHQSIFYHRDVFSKIGLFNLKYAVFADYDFNLRCAAHYPFYYMNLIIANFQVGGVSTQMEDQAFNQDKFRNIIAYFLCQIHTDVFVGLRLYVQRAAFGRDNGISLPIRLYCALVYFKLKLQSKKF